MKPETIIGWGLVVFLLLVYPGCATNKALLTEKLYDAETGNITADTKVLTSVVTTWGSKVQEGAGNVDYSGSGKNPWKLKVGQAATGVEAGGDPVVLFKELMGALRELAPLLSPKPEPAPAPQVELAPLASPSLRLTVPKRAP